MKVLRGVEIFGGMGNDSNTYILDNEIIVDTGTGSFFPQVKKDIENRVSTKNIHTIVNTHCHFDHSGGNKKFRDWLKAEVAVHTTDKKAVETGLGTMAEMFGETARTMTVDKSLENKEKLKTENFVFEVLHTPGHTAGSICLYEKNYKILVSGDTIFSDGVGRTDLPSGSKKDLQESLKKLSKTEIFYLLPGHGTPKIRGVDFLLRQMIEYSRMQ
jgi:hydroxyacylglutathione hydrolase